MANTYKNAFFTLDNTTKQTIYTCPANTTAIIKSIQANNHAGSNPELECFVVDATNSTEYEISHSVIAAKTFVNMIVSPLVLEAGDVLKCQASAAPGIAGFVSLLEIDF